jgi:preprotein translocase subunit SecD
MWQFPASALFLLFTGSVLAAEPLVRLAAETGDHLDFTAGNLRDAGWWEDESNGSRALSFRLDRDSAELVHDFTLRLIGRRVKLFICGDLVTEATLNEPLAGGVFHIYLDPSHRAKLFADILKRGNCS